MIIIQKPLRRKEHSVRERPVFLRPCVHFVRWGSNNGMQSYWLGVTFTKIVRGCACRTSKIWLSVYQFFCQFSTHQYTIFERKAPNFWPNWVLFTIICPKYTQFVHFGLLCNWWNPDRYTKFREKAPQKVSTYYTYTMSMWEPPRYWPCEQGDNC